jgi:ferritin
MAMISQTVQDAINDQINHEFYAAYLYLSMSGHSETCNLPGFASWMRAQAQEEVAHAVKLFDFINDRGGKVILKPVDGPPTDFKSPLDVFENALKHEQKVTGMINKLYETAAAANDFASQVALQWFITEQVEEEKSADLIVEQLKMIGGDRPALLILDREMGARKPGAEGDDD